MSQFVKPVADKMHTSWTGNNVGGSNLYQEVDETVASTDDFTSYDVATATGNSDGPPIVWKVTTISDPSSGTATFRFRTYASQTCTYVLEVRSGYVDESNKGTLLGTSSTQSHPGDGSWHTHTDSAVTFAGGGTGSDLYFRLTSHDSSGSNATIAVTALDADLPDADTLRQLSGTPDILVTTPITGSGTMTAAWLLTDGAPNLTAITGNGTMTTAQGHHELTDGAPNLTALTGTGTLVVSWQLSGAPNLTSITGAGNIIIEIKLSGAPDLLPLFSFKGLAAPVIFRQFTDIRGAADVAQEYLTETLQGRGHSFVIYRRFSAVTGGKGGSKYTIFYIEEPKVAHEDLDEAGIVIAKQIIALRLSLTEQGTVYDFDTADPGYTFIQPQQDLSPKRPCPAADPVNADGVRTERVSYYSRELKVVKP